MLVCRVWQRQLVRRHALACCALTHHPYPTLCFTGVAAAAAAGAATGATGAGGPRPALAAGSCRVRNRGMALDTASGAVAPHHMLCLLVRACATRRRLPFTCACRAGLLCPPSLCFTLLHPLVLSTGATLARARPAAAAAGAGKQSKSLACSPGSLALAQLWLTAFPVLLLPGSSLPIHAAAPVPPQVPLPRSLQVPLPLARPQPLPQVWVEQQLLQLAPPACVCQRVV